jgi:hypothetical protein
MKKTTLKEVFENRDWIITSILKGYNGKHRVSAKRRYPVPDVNYFFCEWGSEKYINKLSIENYYKKITSFNCYKN